MIIWQRRPSNRQLVEWPIGQRQRRGGFLFFGDKLWRFGAVLGRHRRLKQGTRLILGGRFPRFKFGRNLPREIWPFSLRTATWAKRSPTGRLLPLGPADRLDGFVHISGCLPGCGPIRSSRLFVGFPARGPSACLSALSRRQSHPGRINA